MKMFGFDTVNGLETNLGFQELCRFYETGNPILILSGNGMETIMLHLKMLKKYPITKIGVDTAEDKLIV